MDLKDMECAAPILCEVSDWLRGQSPDVTAIILTALTGEWLYSHQPAHRERALAVFNDMARAVCDGHRAASFLERKRADA